MTTDPRLSRRAVIAGTGAMILAAGIGGPHLLGLRGASSTGTPLRSNLVLPPKFRRPLQVPELLPAVRTTADADFYHVTQRVAQQEIIPGFSTEIWGYQGTLPGPTIVSSTGRRTVITHRNELPVPAAVHLHGAKTPPQHDGYPIDVIYPQDWQEDAAGHAGDHDGVDQHAGSDHSTDPGAHQDHFATADTTRVERTYEYPMDQRASTLWYHDHRMDFTGPSVWRGLAGFHLVTDEEEAALRLPDGDRDLPLAIMDRAFDADGALLYPALDPDLIAPPGVHHPYEAGVLGDVVLVNGTPWPYCEVTGDLHRLRFLNASNARRYRLRLDPPPPAGDGPPFVQIGSDGGLLAHPIGHEHLDLASAERQDVLVDFSRYPEGTRVRLRNDFGRGSTAEVMEFRVTLRVPSVMPIPARLSTIERLEVSDAVIERDMVFQSDSIDGMHGWTINGQAFHPEHIHAAPELGSTEIWNLYADFHHPIHLHLVPFQVLGRGTGGPGPFDHGWKDTLDLRPAERARIIVRFDGYRGRYVFHCHNLEHEDMMMMGNFEVR